MKLGLFLLWLCFCLLLLLVSSSGWWELLILVVAIYVIGEWLADRVFASKYALSPLKGGFSLSRIVFNVLLILGLGAGTYLVLRLLS